MSETAKDCRKKAAELRAAGGDFTLCMLLERAAREVDHLNDLVRRYREMLT